jgi:hypothetical protein
MVAPQMIINSSETSSVDFGQIAKQMELGNMTPREVSEARNVVSAYLSRMRWIMGTLSARRAKTVTLERHNYRSLAETERAWEATEAGQQEVTLHHQIKALEQLSSALETNWFLLQGETKNRC